jgi:hypothetical protein
VSVGRIVRIALVAGAASLAVAPGASATYSLVSSPNAFAGNNVLNGVSASSATDAWAVGTLCCARRNAGIGTLTEHWNGLSWSIVPSPDTDFNDEILNAVADISPANVWAVGLIKQSGFRSGVPLIIHWNGTSWQTATAPAVPTGTLRAVSASGANDVWTVGDSGGRAIAFHFDGSSWSQALLPAIGGDMLQGVKAFSATNAWAVGQRVPSSTGTQVSSLIMHWDGSAWSVVPSPNPDPNDNILHAIDGVSPSDVWAVGQKGIDETTTGVPPGTRTLTMHWNGAIWSPVASPNTNDQDTLNGVAAIAANSIAAVGTVVNTSGQIPVQRSLALRWTGTSWAGQVTPVVGTSDNLLKAASRIPGATTAWAVGFRLTSADVDQTLILRGGGG